MSLQMFQFWPGSRGICRSFERISHRVGIVCIRTLWKIVTELLEKLLLHLLLSWKYSAIWTLSYLNKNSKLQQKLTSFLDIFFYSINVRENANVNQHSILDFNYKNMLMNKEMSAPCDLEDVDGKASPQWARPTVPLTAPPLLPCASSFAPNALRPSPVALLTLKT